MLWLAFVIPVITCLILFFVFREQTHPLEYLVVFIPSVIFTIILYACSVHSAIKDTEYLGYYVKEVAYYEPWNEYIHQTCTDVVSDGKGGTKTVTRNCSYVQYHYEEYTMVLNDDREKEITEETYNQIREKFKTPRVFVDLHRNYHTKDGDKYVTRFDGNRDKLWPVGYTGSYENRILGSKSIFKFSEVPQEEFDSLGLLDYPEKPDKYFEDFNPIIGHPVIDPAIVDSFKYLNAIYGVPYEFHCFVLLFENKPQEIVKKQQDYFVGGNKNELIVCIGTSGNRISWVESFSWEDKPKISIGVNHLFHEGDSLDLMKLNRYLLENVPTHWKRKDFDDFSYLSVDLSSGTWLMIFIFTILLNIGISIWVVMNELR